MTLCHTCHLATLHAQLPPEFLLLPGTCESCGAKGIVIVPKEAAAVDKAGDALTDDPLAP